MKEQATSSDLTVDEVAVKLQLEPGQVHDLIAAKALQTTGSGDSLRVTEVSLVVYMFGRAGASMEAATSRPSGWAVASSILVPVTLMLWFLFTAVEILSIQKHKPILPVVLGIGVSLMLLGLSWWFARQADELSSTQGVGTTIYGKRLTNEGRIGTKWLIFAGIPLLPLQSYIILEAGKPTIESVGSPRITKYQLRARATIDWPQAAWVLLATWLGMGGLVLILLK